MKIYYFIYISFTALILNLIYLFPLIWLDMHVDAYSKELIYRACIGLSIFFFFVFLRDSYFLNLRWRVLSGFRKIFIRFSSTFEKLLKIQGGFKSYFLVYLYPVVMLLIWLSALGGYSRDAVKGYGPITWPLFFLMNVVLIAVVKNKNYLTAACLVLVLSALSILIGWRGMLFFFLLIQVCAFFYQNRNTGSWFLLLIVLVISVVAFSMMGMYRSSKAGGVYYDIDNFSIFTLNNAELLMDLIAMRAREHLKGLLLCIKGFLNSPLNGEAFFMDIHELVFLRGYSGDFNLFLKDYHDLWSSDAGGLPSTALGQLIADFGKYGEYVFYIFVIALTFVKRMLWQFMKKYNQFFWVGIIFYYEFLIIADQLYRNLFIMLPYVFTISYVLLFLATKKYIFIRR